jgi:thiol-disulfide isomerase/thioredoxin
MRRAVVVHVADGCHLCDAALDVLHAVRREVAFDLEVVRIDGDPELERRYRADLPVVEIDGERAFRYFVDAEGLRRRLLQR